MNIQPAFSPIQKANKAVIYIRVSSEEQVENFSLKTQEEICRRDAKYKGYEIDQVFREEGKSAKTILGRPELLKMLDYCRKNKKDIQAVYVYRLDRLSRQTSDYFSGNNQAFLEVLVDQELSSQICLLL
ncbi:MAG: recombinase family protein, partial [Actinobacteria bacterium]|nr:recombinase family protein [Actinomycetota bacterium]